MPSSKSSRLAPVASQSHSTANGVRKRRKNVGTACESCKARKLKCSGAPPCANCVKSGHACTLDRTTDRRRRGALTRDIDLLGDRDDLLKRFCGYIQESSNTSTLRFVNFIRNDASLPEIRFYLEHQPPRSDNTQPAEIVNVYESLQGRESLDRSPNDRISDTESPIEAPQFSVPAQPWTSIIKDDDLVSRLISLWFTWVHPTCNFIDRNLFIRDMKTGSPSSSYCSPFLVNVILADACSYSDYAAHGLPSNILSTRTDLYQEAKRLFDKEEGRISLPLVQGLGVLWMCALVIGRDRQGWITRGQLKYSLQELSQTSAHLLSDPGLSSNCMAKVVNYTSWGLFNLAMIHALWMRTHPIIKMPIHPLSTPIGLTCLQDNQNLLSVGPEGDDIHTLCAFNAVSNLNRIAYNLGPLLFSQDINPLSRLELPHDGVAALQELAVWPDGLPHCLKETSDAPHVLSLHMYYHAISTAVYGYLKAQPFYIPNTLALHRPIPDALVSPVHASRACLVSARKIAQLTLIHRCSWGFRMPAADVHYIMAALFSLIDALDDPANCDAFIALMASAGALARRWDCAKSILRNLLDTARQKEIELPAETGNLFPDADHALNGVLPVKSETPEAAIV
ncbi:hypothetical protein BJX70DRAFT_336429 [Aspergillus crustosus]